MSVRRPTPALKDRPPSAKRAGGAVQAVGDFPVVGIGASAGGLEACKKLLEAVPANSSLACILVQHLDPDHESMMVDLLVTHTQMTVLQATEGMRVEPGHVYVIPPGAYLSVAAGALHLSQPRARHGARLPFDFLLHSLAAEYGARAVCVILSGTGSDGSLGLRSVRAQSGLIIAQDPGEAAYDGMPRSAIATGLVDLVLPVARIPEALARGRHVATQGESGTTASEQPEDPLTGIVELLRLRTAHDFTLYKRGTLQRRIERRMSLAGIELDRMHRYLDVLGRDAAELDHLSKDLLINITSFFRDPKVFGILELKIIPELVRGKLPDQQLRIWVAGCSTGAETYSLAMLFREAITAANCRVKLQVFASDVDPDAIAEARAGLYPASIAADVSPARLARFFTREDHGYQVLPELRSSVVFTVQDVLADPPFSRLDMVSCRNLLIYLRPEAQTRVLSLFDFALREGGILLLGNAETVGPSAGRFDIVYKSERIYRHSGRARPGDLAFLHAVADGERHPARPDPAPPPSRHAVLAELCTRIVMENYAPAAVLIDEKNQCVFSLGPTDRYLRPASGRPTHDLLAMAPKGIRIKLRSAIQRASQNQAPVLVGGGRMDDGADERKFSIAVQPVANGAERLLLVCFIDTPHQAGRRTQDRALSAAPGLIELEQELEATRLELQSAIHNLELSSEDQKAINEEALSANEEYQSTNEELLTSKEELQSLNEELTALNSQLQETLERQRTASNDLQNILYSTDMATVFLDRDLNIRFFTPATKSLFNVIPGDIGRPLADLHSLAADKALATDAHAVLHDRTPHEREIETEGGRWFTRRILPYRTDGDGVEGVVITFTDITDRKHAARALEAAKQEAEASNSAKSRFLAAASHDLRQPLQTLALLQGLLVKAVVGERAQKLVGRVDETLSAMSGMLNTLLDINQIEAGAVAVDITDFPLDDLLARLGQEFAYQAQAQGLRLRVVPCRVHIRSDPRLLEQMVRNLLSNALKYTQHGGVLLGGRRRGGMVAIEIWDTGVGMPADQLEAIFQEYHQLGNHARERSRGLGLGLSIVDRLATLLGYDVRVRSGLGKGSVFTIEVPRAHGAPGGPSDASRSATAAAQDDAAAHRHGTILVIEDDPEIRELLAVFLKQEGHVPTLAADGIAALALVARGGMRPDIILSDFNLPNGPDGLDAAAQLRARLGRDVPVIILTGNISLVAERAIALGTCLQINKPVTLPDLAQAIQTLLPGPAAGPPPPPDAEPPDIFIVDDDRAVREGFCSALTEHGWRAAGFPDCEAFIAAYRPGHTSCLLLDAYLPGMQGLELLGWLKAAGHRLPTIMVTGLGDVAMAVAAMKAGAADFAEKPVSGPDLLAIVGRALALAHDADAALAWREAAAAHLADLTPRQRQVMELVLAGHPSKNIAADLGVSQRTVENHRASIMRKTGSRSLPALARLALAAAPGEPDQPVHAALNAGMAK